MEKDSDFEIESEDFEENPPPVKLVENINLKDLCDGKEIMFELNENQEIIFEKNEAKDIVHLNSKLMRENRGAPALNETFESFARKMDIILADGMVKKKIITSGTGKSVPDHAFVTVHYNFYKEHCELPFDSTFLRNYPFKFQLGQGQTICGLEHAVKSMKKNENSCFFIKWEAAFGKMGCPDRIGEKCDIIADVTLINFVEMCEEEDLKSMTENEINNLSFKKFLNEAKKLHLKGSDEFLRGKVKNAIANYKKGIKILNGVNCKDEEQEKVILKQKVKGLINMALCYNKLGLYELACVACQEVLVLDYRNVKAYFHYGRANLALSNFSQAKKLLMTANKLKPNDADINKELKKLNDKKALYEMNYQQFWKKAFKNEDKEVKGNLEEIPSELIAFEENLRDGLEKCLKENKSFSLPGVLTAMEKEICIAIADKMNLSFESQRDFNVFQCKKTENH